MAIARSRWLAETQGAIEVLNKRSCSKLLWLSGLQAVTSSGRQSHYLETSLNYLRYYASALETARQNAPSVVPVLVFFNKPPADFLEWVEGQNATTAVLLLGGLVIVHRISFHDRIAKAVRRDPNHPQIARIEHLVASYARLDIPAIVDKVRAALGNRSDTDFDYAMWTDPDVLFEQDVDSCSLAKPRLVSLGAETIPGTVANCGVMYFNISSFGQTQEALLSYGDMIGWKVEHDQDLFRQFYQRWMVNTLPDYYNYKPYWGERETLRPLPLYVHQDLAEVFIIHTHGPKPSTAICVIDYLLAHKVPVQRDRDLILEHSNEIVERCHMQGMVYVDIILRLIASSVAADGGLMYRRVHEQHMRLCPGACWRGSSFGLS